MRIRSSLVSVRSLSQLKADQASLLSDYRTRLEPESAEVHAEELPPVMTFGRVTGIVYFHATYGQHLRVQPYEYTGMPPVTTPSNKPELRVYATPNYTAFAYGLGDWVAIETVRGSLLAVKLR